VALSPGPDSQKLSGSLSGLKRCPGLVDFASCVLIICSQSLRTASAGMKGNSVSFNMVRMIVSRISILS